MKDKETQEGMLEAYRTFLFSIPKGVSFNQAINNCRNLLTVKSHLGAMNVYKRCRERTWLQELSPKEQSSIDLHYQLVNAGRKQKKSPDQRPGD